jgi:hypothetical protein
MRIVLSLFSVSTIIHTRSYTHFLSLSHTHTHTLTHTHPHTVRYGGIADPLVWHDKLSDLPFDTSLYSVLENGTALFYAELKARVADVPGIAPLIACNKQGNSGKG